MGGILAFAGRFGTQQQGIAHLAKLRWPGGFVRAGCGGRQVWRLKARPRVYECGKRHRQESVAAGTVLHRTRSDLAKWFLAAYLIARDKRGVAAKFLQRELGVADQTAWTMAHKLRHGLSEDPARPLCGLLEADETLIGGRGNPTSRGRSTANPDKSLVVAAVEKVPAPKNKKGRHGHAVKRQHGFFAGNTGSPCCRRRRAPNSAPFSRPMPQPSRTSRPWVRRLSRPRCRPRRAPQAHPGDPGQRFQCRRVLPDHPYAVQQHQSLARRHPSRGQRQAPPALPSGMVLSVQSPQPARRFAWLSDPARRRMRHHHLRSAQSRHQARRRRSHSAPSRISCATCFNPIGILRNAIAHNILDPVWDTDDPELQNKKFSISDVLMFDSSGLNGNPLNRFDFGDPIALFRLSETLLPLLS
jgi:hypothetical protein